MHTNLENKPDYDPQQYWANVTGYLEKMTLGEWVPVRKVAKPETRERFIDCVKLFIKATGYRHEFTEDYEYFRRFRA